MIGPFRFLLVVFALILAAPLLLPAGSAAAHPLGNFTISRFTRLILAPDAVQLHYVVDMAEIPAFQELRSLDRNGDSVYDESETAAYLDQLVPVLLSNLYVELDGSPIALSSTGRQLSFLQGQGGLKTIRLELDATGPMPDSWRQGISAAIRDGNYSDRLGWKEVVVQGAEGVSLKETSALTVSVSDELRSYPEDKLSSPLDMRSAQFSFQPGDSSLLPVQKDQERSSGSDGSKNLDGFSRLIERENLTPAFIIFSLLAAAAWGAAHALGPGHGKTLVAAYLIGERGTAKHAMILGLTVTVTHTSSVIALGLVTLYASRYFAAEDLYVWLGIASGLLVVVMGATLLFNRLRTMRRSSVAATIQQHDEAHHHQDELDDHGHDHHEHPHAHDDHGHHDSDHGHSHAQPTAVAAHSHGGHSHSHLPSQPGLKGLIALGISGGILPCPTAMVVMLGAIALDRVVYGLVLVGAFSLGLAGVLTAIGIALVYARGMLKNSTLVGRVGSLAATRRFIQAVPLLSAGAILVLGILLTGRAVSGAL